MSTRANCRCSSGIDDPEKLYALRDLFDRYRPVARLLLDEFNIIRDYKAYGEVIYVELVGLLRTGVPFLYDLLDQGDSHTIVLLLPESLEASAPKYISRAFRRKIATPIIWVRLGFLATIDTTFKG